MLSRQNLQNINGPLGRVQLPTGGEVLLLGRLAVRDAEPQAQFTRWTGLATLRQSHGHQCRKAVVFQTQHEKQANEL